MTAENTDSTNSSDNPQAAVQALFETAQRAGTQYAQMWLQALAPQPQPQANNGAGQKADDVAGPAGMLQSLLGGLARNSTQWQALQERHYRQHVELWTRFVQAADSGAPQEPLVSPDASDRRFQAPEWQQLPFFDYLKQSYLLNARWLTEMVDTADLDPALRQKLRFYARQMSDAASPANFAATNPEVLKLAHESGGESLLRGLENLKTDIGKGRITITDESAFEVGRNLAITPGAVVFENEVMQLIQYRPSTDAVYERPLLIVPPCINKYYILDLQPDNSFVRYAVAQGHTVFMVSWRNMPPALGHVTWDDYLEQGVIQATEVASGICGVDSLNVLGFCIGGTLVAAALAVLKAKGREPAASLTLLTTLLDFGDTGDISVYVDEAFVQKRERDFAQGGVLDGKELAATFSSLRPNDLVWNYVVNNYLKGRSPEPFDLLYWNCDSTNLPGAMYLYYLRNTYLENNLRVPGKLSMCGVPVDLSSIAVPTYVLAAREDHIVPWRTAYESARLLGGDVEFVLAASGHIAGVVNPAAKNKRHHWVNSASLPAAPEAWLEQAEQRPGSWWSAWSAWLAPHGGAMVAAREPGTADYPVLEAAPGRYVSERVDAAPATPAAQ